MKEQLFEILKVGRDVVYGDIPGLIADIEHLVNQEVERRIKERMPSEEWIASEARKRFTSNTGFFESAKYQGFIRCGKWLRSRLTNNGEGGME